MKLKRIFLIALVIATAAGASAATWCLFSGHGKAPKPPVREETTILRDLDGISKEAAEITPGKPPVFVLMAGGKKIVAAPAVMELKYKAVKLLADAMFDFPFCRQERSLSGELKGWQGLVFPDGSHLLTGEAPFSIDGVVFYKPSFGVWPVILNLRWEKGKARLPIWEQALSQARMRRTGGGGAVLRYGSDDGERAAILHVKGGIVTNAFVAYTDTGLLSQITPLAGRFYSGVNEMGLRGVQRGRTGPIVWKAPFVIPDSWAGSARREGALDIVGLRNWTFDAMAPVPVEGTLVSWHASGFPVSLALAFEAKDRAAAEDALARVYGCKIGDEPLKGVRVSGREEGGYFIIGMTDTDMRDAVYAYEVLFGEADIRRLRNQSAK